METDNPKISVIVPVYNVEKYLPCCIDSILGQTFTDFELLLIDDGSKDKSGKICDEYAKKDKRIRVFHKENGGVSSARNLGLDNARGEWITFCDSDDWVDNTFLQTFNYLSEKQYDLLSQGFFSPNWKNKDTSVVNMSNYVSTDKHRLIDFILESYSNGMLGYIWCKAFKKSIIEDFHIRFNVNYILMEDLLFVCQYCTHINSLINVSDHPYHYTFTLCTDKYKKNDNMQICMDIYYNLEIIAGGDIENLRRIYFDNAVLNLFLPSNKKSKSKFFRFFYDNFFYLIRGCESNASRVKLLRELCFIQNYRYFEVVVSIIHLLINLKCLISKSKS